MSGTPALAGERHQSLRDRAELGISPENPPEQNLQLLRRMWSDRPRRGAPLERAPGHAGAVDGIQ